MFFIYASISNDNGDWDDDIVIGLFSSVEKTIDAAWNWVREERGGGSDDDICLCGWRVSPDSTDVERLDLANDEEAKSLIIRFRDIEKEFPVEK